MQTYHYRFHSKGRIEIYFAMIRLDLKGYKQSLLWKWLSRLSKKVFDCNNYSSEDYQISQTYRCQFK